MTETIAVEVEIIPAEASKALVGLEPSQATSLAESFRPIFAKAKAAKDAAAGVAESVKDATCVMQIKKSRECRLAIRRVRLESEENRKAKKEVALIYGRAVDGFHNILLAELSPVETALQAAEDTAERAETARLDGVEQGRLAALRPFVSDASIYQVRLMPEAAFTELLNNSRIAKEAVEAAKAKSESDRLAKIAADKKAADEQAAENARLKKLSDDQAAQIKRDKDAADEEAKRLKAIADKATADSKALRDAEIKRKSDADAADKKRLGDEAEAKRKAEAAPDKEKLMELSDRLANPKLPALQSPAGKELIELIAQKLGEISLWVANEANQL